MSRSVLLAKMFLDRRNSRGAAEFAFRWRTGHAAYHVVSVRSRRGGSARDLYLRRHTTDLWTFEQVFCNNDYNLRKLARWDDIDMFYSTSLGARVPLILDLGANVGLASLHFAMSWPDAAVIAVEPSADNFFVLQKNIEGIAKVQAIQAAVASADGFVKISNPNAEEWAFRTKWVARGQEGRIPAKSVPSLLDLAGHTVGRCQPFICKIDIEGFEANLFSENVDWIDLFPVIIVELHDWCFPRERTSRSFLTAISQRDRDFVYTGENVFSIRNEL